MMIIKKKLLGSRIPEKVIEDLKVYCKSHGILINHFITEAIKEKLTRMKKREEKTRKEDLLED